MTDLSSSCITCLSLVDGGAKISRLLLSFLRTQLSFKIHLLDKPSNLLCRQCYSTLLEIRRFCSLLRDTEEFLQLKWKAVANSGADDADDLIEEVDETVDDEMEAQVEEPSQCNAFEEIVDVGELENVFTMEYNSNVDGCGQVNDPILTTGEPIMNVDYHVIESSEPPSVPVPKIPKNRPKKSDPNQNREIPRIPGTEFQLNEATEATKVGTDIKPLFRPSRKRWPCMMCGQNFPTKRDLNVHLRHHELEKSKPFRCDKCNRRYPSEGELRDHQLVHNGTVVQTCQCDICGKKYFNQPSLDAHKRIAHNFYEDYANQS